MTVAILILLILIFVVLLAQYGFLIRAVERMEPTDRHTARTRRPSR